MSKPTTNSDAIDAILHDEALVDAETGSSTQRQRRIASQVRTSVQARLAELRRGLLPAPTPPVKAGPLPSHLLALGRDALMARLDDMVRVHGTALQFAHRNLAGLSDDDLRRMIAILEDMSSTTG
jgi:hypothetical protein